MKRHLIALLTCGFAALLLLASPVAALARPAPSADPVTERHGIADCLVVQNQVGYGNADVIALQAEGISYDVINSSSLAAWDLTEYKFIILADGQRHSYYDDVAAALPHLRSYVESGGLLYVHAYEELASTHDLLPGAPVKIANAGSTQARVIGDPADRLLIGMPPGYFDGVVADCNGAFDGLPAGSGVLIVATDAGDAPVYVRYRLGHGTVVADAISPEYFYDELPMPEMLLNQLRFGAAWQRTVEEDCFTEQRIIMPTRVGFTVGHKLKVTVSDTSVSLGKVLPGTPASGGFVLTVWSNDEAECLLTHTAFTGYDIGVNDEGADELGSYPDGVTRTDWGPDDRYDIDEAPGPYTIGSERISVSIGGAPYAGGWYTIATAPTGDSGVTREVTLGLETTYQDHAGFYTGSLQLDVRQF